MATFRERVPAYKAAFRRLPGVQGVGSTRDALGRDAVLVILDRTILGAGLDVPDQIEGHPVFVIYSGPIQGLGMRTPAITFGQADPHTRIRPIQPGSSISPLNHPLGPIYGTLGGIVFRNGEPYIISNNHVLNWQSNSAGPIVQPGVKDGGTAADIVADPGVFLPWNANGNNDLDISLAKLLPGMAYNEAPLGMGLPSGAFQLPALNETVYKSGATTGLSNGLVVSIDADLTAQLDRPYRFVDQIVVYSPVAVPPFSRPGDSGSLCYDISMNCVGLLFAGAIDPVSGDSITTLNRGPVVESYINGTYVAPSGGLGNGILIAILGIVAALALIRVMGNK